MGVFHPQASCEWYVDGSYSYCDGTVNICKVDAVQTKSHCITDDATDETTDKNRRNAFVELAKRMEDAIDNERDDRTDDAPKSSFDVIGYIAKELDQDWGVIGERFADNLENLAKNDWEELFKTFNGDVYASENAAYAVTALSFYRDWVVKLTKPLKGV